MADAFLQGMNDLSRRNTQSLAIYLYKIAGCPEGRELDSLKDAEEQLSHNLFRDETDSVDAQPGMTPQDD